MTQLTFQPALDPFHAVFRILRLRDIVRQRVSLHVDFVRIMDFYLLFPFLIQAIRLLPAHQKYKKLSGKYLYLKPYGEAPESRLLFERMEPMHTAALETLAARSLIDIDEFMLDQVRMSDADLPNEIAARVNELNQEQSDLMAFLGVLASEYTLSGDSGLKARTGLMEYRYDAL